MLKIVKPEEIKSSIVAAFQNHSLVPIVGSGLSRGLSTGRGQVPSGSDYKAYMIDSLSRSGRFTAQEVDELKKSPFSHLCDYYEDDENISEDLRFTYLENNFYRAHFAANDPRLDFFKIDWPYIYSLNIDDAIENSSRFNTVIVPYRQTRDDIFSNENCLIKLHGDIRDIVKYKSSAKVFTSREYALSIEKNAPVLTKLRNDYSYQNVIFVGCSLDDEIDLKTLSDIQVDYTRKDSLSKVILMTASEPTALQKSRYKTYGITDVVCFDSYGAIYSFLYDAWSEATSVQTGDLDKYCHLDMRSLSAQKDKNHSYYFWGKSLFNEKNKAITYPYYFTSRKLTQKIVKNLNLGKVHLISGSHVSGKTYLLADLYRTIRDRELYFFDGKTKISNNAIASLLEKDNIVVLFDSGALSREQFEMILNHGDAINKRQSNYIIAINQNDGDTFGIVKWKLKQGLIKSTDVIKYEVSNRFSDSGPTDEISRINNCLPVINIPVWDPKRTILDQLIYAERQLNTTGKYSKTTIAIKTEKELALLIILAIREKMSTLEVVKFSLESEMHEALKRYDPFIEKTATFDFEKDANDLSQIKYILNSKYWLQRQLGDYARQEKNYKIIAAAYRYIILKVLESASGNDYLQRRKCRDYILFDVMNDIFLDRHRGNLALIMYIYNELHDMLSNDYNFLHQKAKCCLNCAYALKSPTDSVNYLQTAKELAAVSQSMIELRYEKSQSEHLMISLAHIHYTLATIYSEFSHLQNYSNPKEVESTIDMISLALLSPYNQDDYTRDRKRRASHGIVNFLNSAVQIAQLPISPEHRKKLETLIGGISNSSLSGSKKRRSDLT